MSTKILSMLPFEFFSAEEQNIEGEASCVNYAFKTGEQLGATSSSINLIEVDEDNEFEYRGIDDALVELERQISSLRRMKQSLQVKRWPY